MRAKQPEHAVQGQIRQGIEGRDIWGVTHQDETSLFPKKEEPPCFLSFLSLLFGGERKQSELFYFWSYIFSVRE